MTKKEDEERLHNLIIYKLYVTDKELEELSPGIILGIIVLVSIIIIALARML